MRPEYGVHNSLEYRVGITKAKRHNEAIIVSIVGVKGSFVSIRRVHPYLMIS